MSVLCLWGPRSHPCVLLKDHRGLHLLQARKVAEEWWQTRDLEHEERYQIAPQLARSALRAPSATGGHGGQ